MAEVNASALVHGKRERLKPVEDAPFSVIPHAAIESLCRYASAAPEGCFVEVGVYLGGSAFFLNQIAQKIGVRLYLYDTFEGIPYQNEEMGDRHAVGDFDDTSQGYVASMVPEAIIVRGIFPQSIIPMPKVAFAHIDCDQYQSIIESVAALQPLMVEGGMMLFDDYGCLEGATRAVKALFPEDRIILTDAGKALVIF